jgi:hypothetical protein
VRKREGGGRRREVGVPRRHSVASRQSCCAVGRDSIGGDGACARIPPVALERRPRRLRREQCLQNTIVVERQQNRGGYPAGHGVRARDHGQLPNSAPTVLQCCAHGHMHAALLPCCEHVDTCRTRESSSTRDPPCCRRVQCAEYASGSDDPAPVQLQCTGCSTLSAVR